MRNAYLSHSARGSGCRGGVSSISGEYELEVGSQCMASPEMLALCTLIDEVRELLENNSGTLGQMVLEKWKKEVKRLKESEDKSYMKNLQSLQATEACG